MTPDEALRRVRDPHEVLQLTDVELIEAAVTLAVEIDRLRAENAEMRWKTQALLAIAAREVTRESLAAKVVRTLGEG